MTPIEASRYLGLGEQGEPLVRKLIAMKRLRTNTSGSISSEECDSFRNSNSRMAELKRLRAEVTSEATAAAEAKREREGRRTKLLGLLKRAANQHDYKVIQELTDNLLEIEQANPVGANANVDE